MESRKANSNKRKSEEIEQEAIAKIHRAKRGISAPYVVNEAEPAALSKEAHFVLRNSGHRFTHGQKVCESTHENPTVIAIFLLRD